MLRLPRLAPVAAGLLVLGACIGGKLCERSCSGCGGGSRVSMADAAAGSVPAPAVPALPDFTAPAWTRVPSRANRYLVCWRPTSGTVPRNQDFDLEVWVLEDGAPLPECGLSVSAWMPEHGHGMLRRPEVRARGDGSFVIAGMLLHMRGHWQVVFDVQQGSQSEAAECALDL